MNMLMPPSHLGSHHVQDPQGRSGKDPTPFVFAGPDEFKLDTSISIFDKYKMYIASKPWVKDNYLRIPDRKPDWI